MSGASKQEKQMIAKYFPAKHSQARSDILDDILRLDQGQCGFINRFSYMHDMAIYRVKHGLWNKEDIKPFCKVMGNLFPLEMALYELMLENGLTNSK